MAANEKDVLLQRIIELEIKLSETSLESKKRQLRKCQFANQLDDLKVEREALVKERESLKTSPSEWVSKYEAIEKNLRERDSEEQKSKGKNLAFVIRKETLGDPILFTRVLPLHELMKDGGTVTLLIR